MRERIATIGPMAALAGAFGICCGLPILLSMGVAGALAGWSLQSWALIGLGLVLAAVGLARRARRRLHEGTCQRPAPLPDADAVQTADSTSDITMRGNNL